MLFQSQKHAPFIKLLLVFCLLFAIAQSVPVASFAAFPIHARVADSSTATAAYATPIPTPTPDLHSTTYSRSSTLLTLGLSLLTVTAAILAIVALPASVGAAIGWYLAAMILGCWTMLRAWIDSHSAHPHDFIDLTAFILAFIPLLPIDVAAGIIILIYDLFRLPFSRRKRHERGE